MPWGNFKPKWLIFSGLPKCMLQRDNILSGAPDVNEHNKTLRVVQNRQRTTTSPSTRRNANSIQTWSTSLDIDFHQTGSSQTSAPQTKEEICSFLGFTGILYNFILNYVTIVAPLRELTKHDGNKTASRPSFFALTQKRQHGYSAWNNDSQRCYHSIPHIPAPPKTALSIRADSHLVLQQWLHAEYPRWCSALSIIGHWNGRRIGVKGPNLIFQRPMERSRCPL